MASRETLRLLSVLQRPAERGGGARLAAHWSADRVCCCLLRFPVVMKVDTCCVVLRSKPHHRAFTAPLPPCAGSLPYLYVHLDAFSWIFIVFEILNAKLTDLMPVTKLLLHEMQQKEISH